VLTEFEQGYVFGLLVGEGHFGGDGRGAQVTLRMHVRHEHLFRWLERALPGGRLYGPYSHGGRHYYQWMARGRFLENVLIPFLAARLHYMDEHIAERFLAMCRDYDIPISGHPRDGGGLASEE
jgi:hypothetical protein